MLDHPGEVPGVRQLQDDVQLVVLDEGRQVLDDIRMVELLQQLDLLHAVQPGLAVHHLEDLHLLERHRLLIVHGPGPVHHAELPLPDLLVDCEACESSIWRVRGCEIQQLCSGGLVGLLLTHRDLYLHLVHLPILPPGCLVASQLSLNSEQ